MAADIGARIHVESAPGQHTILQYNLASLSVHFTKGMIG